MVIKVENTFLNVNNIIKAEEKDNEITVFLANNTIVAFQGAAAKYFKEILNGIQATYVDSINQKLKEIKK
jgi:hypothetical protein